LKSKNFNRPLYFNGEGYESSNDTNLIYNNDSC
jgi:hypothetical protein